MLLTEVSGVVIHKVHLVFCEFNLVALCTLLTAVHLGPGFVELCALRTTSSLIPTRY